MRTSLLVVVVAMVISFIAIPTMALPGEFQPIDNINDRHIQELGAWAVSVYDSKANAALRFNRVIGGQYQIVSGTRYHLIIEPRWQVHGRCGRAGMDQHTHAIPNCLKCPYTTSMSDQTSPATRRRRQRHPPPATSLDAAVSDADAVRRSVSSSYQRNAETVPSAHRNRKPLSAHPPRAASIRPNQPTSTSFSFFIDASPHSRAALASPPRPPA
ncbi:hypothetical protein EJB05_07610, partial [Eragrostis curvula]